MKKSTKYAYFIIASLIVFSSLRCGLVEKVAIKSTGSILGYGVESLYEEEDLIIAEQAIMASLKLLEGLIKGAPDNEKLLLMAIQGYTGYALGFVEDEDTKRAKIFYERAKNYGLRILNKKKAFKNAFSGNIDDFEKSLKAFNKGDVPALFWTANAWGNWLNLSLDSPKAIAGISKLELTMKRVLELDETFYHGGPNLFFAVFYGGRSKMFGGDPVKSKEYYDKFMKISDGKFLMGQFLFAKFYSVQMQDKALFRELLEYVIDTPGDVLPQQRLVNEMAKVKAETLLDEIDVYF